MNGIRGRGRAGGVTWCSRGKGRRSAGEWWFREVHIIGRREREGNDALAGKGSLRM